MKKTKQRILNKALELFNSKGIASISIRQLAQEINISHSNILYHFPSKQEIVLALHELMLNHAIEINQRIDLKQFSLTKFYEITKLGFAVVYDFRFLFNELQYICSSFPKMKKTLISVQKLRSEMYYGVIQLMTEQQLMRQEEFEGEYSQLVDLIKIYSDHWLVSSTIYDEFSKTEMIDNYAHLFMSFFYPYLTDTGKEEFRKIQTTNHKSD